MGKFINRTHKVRMTIVHDNKPYFKGDTITFGPEVPADEIRELIQLGYLDGMEADEIEADRLVTERMLGISLMPLEDQKKIFRQYMRLDPAEQRLREIEEARKKDDATAARLANTDEAIAARSRRMPAPESATEIAAAEEAASTEE